MALSRQRKVPGGCGLTTDLRRWAGAFIRTALAGSSRGLRTNELSRSARIQLFSLPRQATNTYHFVSAGTTVRRLSLRNDGRSEMDQKVDCNPSPDTHDLRLRRSRLRQMLFNRFTQYCDPHEGDVKQGVVSI